MAARVDRVGWMQGRCGNVLAASRVDWRCGRVWLTLPKMVTWKMKQRNKGSMNVFVLPSLDVVLGVS